MLTALQQESILADLASCKAPALDSESEDEGYGQSHQGQAPAQQGSRLKVMSGGTGNGTAVGGRGPATLPVTLPRSALYLVSEHDPCKAGQQGQQQGQAQGNGHDESGGCTAWGWWVHSMLVDQG